METTGYSPVPRGLNSLSQIVCALHASCMDWGESSFRKISLKYKSPKWRQTVCAFSYINIKQYMGLLLKGFLEIMQTKAQQYNNTTNL